MAVIADGLPNKRGSEWEEREGMIVRAAPRIISVISSFLRRAPWRERKQSDGWKAANFDPAGDKRSFGGRACVCARR